MQGDLFSGPVTAGAHLQGPYRYSLWRGWDAALPICVFVMLNPSTATDALPDQTMTKCVGFAKRWGFGSLLIVNLFAWRTPSPAVLVASASEHDIVGPVNDEQILSAVGRAGRVVAAWGATGGYRGRAARVLEMIAPLCDVWALQINADGSPKHPLYVSYDKTEPFIWQRRKAG
jgi:hypothetical protein